MAGDIGEAHRLDSGGARTEQHRGDPHGQGLAA
jgi:hypothetical protein